MSRTIPAGAATGGVPKPRASLPSGYFRRSELPLHGLVFLLPAVVLFEVGTRVHPADPIAFRMLQRVFEQLGASGRCLPALLLILMLLGWHVARGDAWKISFSTLWMMAVESWALCLPLLALGVGVARWNIRLPLAAGPERLVQNAILSLGAGIYEELLFRLILMTLLWVFLIDVMRLNRRGASILIVIISGVLFSLYHYLGSEPFQYRTFVFRAIAGAYFAVLFLTRGFGITCGCHTIYDIIIVAVQAMSGY